MTERKFDWTSRHDSKSKLYRFGVSGVVPTKKYWAEGITLNQYAEGACTAFGAMAELLASPKPAKTTFEAGNKYALEMYQRIKEVDEWPGVDYDGSSVLAAMKVLQERNFITGYRWAMSIDEVREALQTAGPVVIGINWYDSMYETRRSGLVEVAGKVVGGHCLTLTGYNPSARLTGEGKRYEVYRWKNSWGNVYGVNGSGYVKAEDLAALLATTGEAAIPTGRLKVKLI